MDQFCQFSFSKKGVVVRIFAPLLLLLLISTAHAAEKIINFHSDITVNRDGSLDVVEQITVNAEGQNIKRGIYRDLPNSYDHPEYGKFGFKSRAPVSVVDVQRNGAYESHHVQKLINGVRVFFGSKNRFLKRGEHTYTFHYTAERQIGIDSDTAQLYWNVTGNGWFFPIDQASATITVPGNSTIYEQAVFTGYQGSALSNARFDNTSKADLLVQTTKSLTAGEGMTVKVRFDSAELMLPQTSELALLYRDNKLWFWGAGLLSVMALVLFIFWMLIGRDPRRGIVIAQYRPVEDLSAAAHRAVFRNRVDDISFSVGVLSAAIKGWLTISKSSDDTYTLTATDTEKGDKKSLSKSEKLLVNGLFKRRRSVTLNGKYKSWLETLKERYDKFLQTEFAFKSHQPHAVPLVIGGLIGLVGLVLMATVTLSEHGALIGVMILTIVVTMFISGIAVRALNGSFGYTIVLTSVALAAVNIYHANTLMAIALAAYGSVLALFMYLMPAPKQVAVDTLDRIEGFRLYLSKAEHDSLKRLNLPEKTPQLYEELLPFAIALDLETEWSNQFTEVLAAANWDADKNAGRTNWYTGGSGSSMRSFAPAVAAGLASGVVAASTPPSSSSSGGGGGGFSGGGGGGGGGGGW